LANVGTISVKLAADPAGFISGLDSAKKSLQNFGSTIGNAVTAPGRALQSALAAPMAAIESFLTPIKNLATSIPFVGAAFAALPVNAGGFVAFLQDGLNRVAQMTKLSDQLGVSTETLGALAKSAGGDFEAVAASMSHFARTLASAQSGNREDQSKLRSIGLDPSTLPRSPEKAIGPLLDAISAMPDQSSKLEAAFRVLGRSGEALAPAFQKGAAGLEELKQKMQASGQGFSSTQGTIAQMAVKSLGQMNQAIQGLQTQLAVQLAPFIKAAADAFNDVTLSGVNMGSIVSSAIEGIATAVASVIDFVHGIGTAWKYVEVGFNAFLSITSSGIASLFELAAKLPDALGGAQFRQAAELARNIAEEFDKGAKAASDAASMRGFDPSSAERVKKFFDDIRSKAAAAAEAAKKTGAVGGGLVDTAVFDRGLKRIQELRTPAEVLHDELQEITREFAAGAYNAEIFGRATKSAIDKFNSASKMSFELPKANTADSKEGLDFESKLANGAGADNTQQQALDELRKMNPNMAKACDLLGKVVEKLNFKILGI
jgi:hypothetical protein